MVVTTVHVILMTVWMLSRTSTVVQLSLYVIANLVGNALAIPIIICNFRLMTLQHCVLVWSAGQCMKMSSMCVLASLVLALHWILYERQYLTLMILVNNIHYNVANTLLVIPWTTGICDDFSSGDFSDCLDLIQDLTNCTDIIVCNYHPACSILC